MKKLLLVTIALSTLAGSVKAKSSLFHENMPFTQSATAVTLLPTEFAIKGVASTYQATFIALLAVFNPSEAVEITQEALASYNREEVENAIDRNDVDTLDSIRDAIRHALLEEGQIENLDQLNDKDVNILIDSVYYIPHDGTGNGKK